MSKTGTDLREQLEVRKEREERNAEKKEWRRKLKLLLWKILSRLGSQRVTIQCLLWMINWKSLSLIWEMGDIRSEKMDRLMQYFRDRDDMFKKDCSM